MAADWTNACRGVRFLWLPIPAYSSLAVLIWVMAASIWTFLLALVVMGFLTYLYFRGRSVPWVVRRIKCSMRGRAVLARPVWFRRRVQHINSFDLIDLK